MEEWPESLSAYTITLYAAVPRRTSIEEESETRRTKLSAAATRGEDADRHEVGRGDDVDDHARDEKRRDLLKRLEDPDRQRVLNPRSISDDEHQFPVAGAPLLLLNGLASPTAVCVAADGRVSLANHEAEATVVLGTRVLWQWNSEVGWVDFDSEHQSRVERAYQADPRSSVTFNVFGIGEFVVNFRSMQQRNMGNGSCRPVRRHANEDGSRMVPNAPALVTIVVDVVNGSLTTYVDGYVSAVHSLLSDSARFYLDTNKPLILFGHSDAARVTGGCVEWLSVQDMALTAVQVRASVDEVTAMTEWACSFCTTRNSGNAVACKVCEIPRAMARSPTVPNTTPGAPAGTEMWWTCGCTKVNSCALQTCSFCQVPRGAKWD
jgi:hypothetical protein